MKELLPSLPSMQLADLAADLEVNGATHDDWDLFDAIVQELAQRADCPGFALQWVLDFEDHS
jgi:hypothetical protein